MIHTNDAEEKVWLVRPSQKQHSCLQCIDGDDDDDDVGVAGGGKSESDEWNALRRASNKDGFVVVLL